MIDPSSAPEQLAQKIADAVCALPAGRKRQLVAIAGPPGAGKSTITTLARTQLEARDIPVGFLPMDGFHYDNEILAARGLQHRKGAPETFDLAGFHCVLRRLLVEDEVVVPEFDRVLDKSIAARSVIATEQRIVLVEGNYLLLDEPGWSDLREFWALRVFLHVPLPVLEARLTDRWVAHGFDPAQARDRAMTNDIGNARRVFASLGSCDLTLG